MVDITALIYDLEGLINETVMKITVVGNGKTKASRKKERKINNWLNRLLARLLVHVEN